MTRVDNVIEMAVPVGTAYNQFTQFEEFPRFMEGVQEVRQLDESRLLWVFEAGGRHREWHARITRQVPDHLLAWEGEDGDVVHAGTVIFKPLGPDRTEVELHIEFESAGLGESPASIQDFVSHRIAGDMERFRDFVEGRGVETGAWRGEIIHGEERPVAPLMDSTDAPSEEQVRFNVTPLQ